MHSVSAVLNQVIIGCFVVNKMGILLTMQGFHIRCKNVFLSLNALNPQFWPALSTSPRKRRVNPEALLAKATAARFYLVVLGGDCTRVSTYFHLLQLLHVEFPYICF